jgi:hypothetical protein
MPAPKFGKELILYVGRLLSGRREEGIEHFTTAASGVR